MAEETPETGGDRPRPARPARQPSGADVGWGITGTLISGMAVWGGVGWLLDQWWGTRVFFPLGVLLGVGVAIYVVVIKYGAVPPPPGTRTQGRTPGAGQRRPGSQTGTQKGRR